MRPWLKHVYDQTNKGSDVGGVSDQTDLESELARTACNVRDRLAEDHGIRDKPRWAPAYPYLRYSWCIHTLHFPTLPNPPALEPSRHCCIVSSSARRVGGCSATLLCSTRHCECHMNVIGPALVLVQRGDALCTSGLTIKSECRMLTQHNARRTLFTHAIANITE